MQASGGRGHGAALARINSLVALLVRGPVLARNIRRERHMAKPLDARKEVRDGRKSNAALAKQPSGHDLSLELATFSKIKVLAHADLAARPDQAFPIIRIGADLPRKQHFHRS